jgi:hypothetical protein
MEVKMKTVDELAKRAETISNAIVELVERTDGPVTLAQIAREIPGFAQPTAPAWQYAIEDAEGDLLIWDGMTEAATTALRKVLRGRKVAVQLVDVRPYLLDGCVITAKNWLPIVLLPKKAANLDTPRWRMRVSPGFREYAHGRAVREGLSDRLLTPRPFRFTADQFAAA